MHAYLFWKIQAAFGPLGRWAFLVAGVLVLLVLAPVLLQMLDRARYFRVAKLAGWVGYNWLAVIFWFVMLGLATDAWNGIVWLTGMAAPSARSAMLPPRPTMYVMIAIVAGLFCWGLAEVYNIRLREVVITVPHLPDGRSELRITQITDLHLGLHTGNHRLQQVIDRVNELHCDVLISTGDLIDSPMPAVQGMADALAVVNPPLGKYAILGNHEFYAGLGTALPFHQAAGFHLLREEAVELVPGVRLAGVDYPGGQQCLPDEGRALHERVDGDFTLLMKHQPRVNRDSLGKFDLQISGHTHGGQIFPFQLFTWMVYGRVSGMYDLPEGAKLFVSTGAGTWGPHLRVGAQPEVVVYVLRAEKP
jgi:predicted MPP superfamily phosphohydrolase